MHIRNGDFRRQFCTNPIRCSMEAGEPSTRRSPQVRSMRNDRSNHFEMRRRNAKRNFLCAKM